MSITYEEEECAVCVAGTTKLTLSSEKVASL